MYRGRVKHAPILLIVLGLALVSLSQVYGLPGADARTGVAYHVDCTSGNDVNNGTSPSSAWKSISKANKANLEPGDSLLLKRGCSWEGPLNARWNGNSVQPIIISAYGSGDLPTVKNATDGQVKITGSYQIIENMKVTNDANAYDSMAPSCANQPVGWRIGFNFVGGHHNTVRNSVATGLSFGVHFTNNSSQHSVLNNRIVDNYGAWNINRTWPQGGTGIALHGSGHEVAYNHFEGNKTRCWDESVSIELYDAINSNVHHNTSYGDKVFVETGSGKLKSADNTFAYNVHVTKSDGARFAVTRGEGHQFGPVLRTKLLNNSVYFTGSNSQGVVCENCSPNILTMRNNIIVATRKALYVGGNQGLDESHNIFWRTGGEPRQHDFIQNVNLHNSSKYANPQYVNPGGNDLQVKAGSPAIDAGTNTGYGADVKQASVPQGSAVDIGAHEQGGTGKVPDNSVGLPVVPEPKPEPAIPAVTSLPGQFEAENYRGGGTGVGFNDTTIENLGGEYRSDAVDIQTTSDTTGGYNVGWPDAGEWLAYDVDVATTADYIFTIRVASMYDGRSFHIELDGENVTGSITTPNTGGWQTWTDVSTGPVNIAAGKHTLKIVAETQGYNLNYVEVTEAGVAMSMQMTVASQPDGDAADATSESAVDVPEGDAAPEDVNVAPAASFAYECAELVCSFDGTASTDSDGTVQDYSWDFGDGVTESGVALNHTYVAGTFIVTLTVTDDEGETNSVSQTVTVEAADEVANEDTSATESQNVTPATSMHVGDLDWSIDGEATPSTEEITIIVHDDNHQPVADVLVTGYWDDDSQVEVSCTTDASGTCSLEYESIEEGAGVTFAVAKLSHASLSYDSQANHIPEGDDADEDVSDGTVIVLKQ